ncbi:MAG: ATP synthase F1 subunit delta [Bacteroidia bacterium]|nr:ATP synthase F1 subunit delta [Bacteroidia bacterium]
MKGSKAAIRYAKALLQQAKEVKAADKVFVDMQAVAHTLKDSKELRSVLKSPVIKASDKKEALLEIFSSVSEDTKNVIGVLVDNQRVAILGAVADSYVYLYNEAKGVKVASVTTAIPLSAAIESQVLAKVKELTGSNTVTLENTIDESIIGGFILRVGDLQYNSSIANNLNKLKREFTVN